MKALNIVLAVVGGAIAGAAVGLLLAPEKGEDSFRRVSLKNLLTRSPTSLRSNMLQ